MSDQSDIRRSAIRAMKAVTASAILFAGVACSDDESSSTGFDVGEEDAGDDVATTTDTGPTDTGSDIGPMDTGNDTTVADTGPDIGPADTGNDTTVADTGPDIGPTDTGTDTDPQDTGTDTAVADADTGQDCNTEKSTGECPDHCDFDNDVDCCKEFGGFWDDGFCVVAVPGPFVPPAMTA